MLINPWHACVARVTVVGLCVCVCVHGYSGTTDYGVAYERYKLLQNYEILKNEKGIFQKLLRSGDMV